MKRFMISATKKKTSSTRFQMYYKVLYVDCETVQGLNSNNFSKHPVATYGDICISV